MRIVVVFTVCVLETPDGVPVMTSPGFARKGIAKDHFMIPLVEANGNDICQQRQDIHDRIDKALDAYEDLNGRPPKGTIKVWSDREVKSP
jgi:hypothetical protein